MSHPAAYLPCAHSRRPNTPTGQATRPIKHTTRRLLRPSNTHTANVFPRLRHLTQTVYHQAGTRTSIIQLLQAPRRSSTSTRTRRARPRLPRQHWRRIISNCNSSTNSKVRVDPRRFSRPRRLRAPRRLLARRAWWPRLLPLRLSLDPTWRSSSSSSAARLCRQQVALRTRKCSATTKKMTTTSNNALRPNGAPGVRCASRTG